MTFSLGPHWGPVVVAGAVAFGTLSVGGLLTEIGPWYRGLRKPRWQPPDWLFAPAWTLIFILGTWSAVLAWRHAPGQAERTMVIGLFALNVLLNVAWSLFFFKWRRPDWALMEVALLWLSIVLLIVDLITYTRLGAVLLSPYLLWVSFASFLNWTIVRLNPREQRQLP